MPLWGWKPSGRSGWLHLRMEHTEATESSYAGIPDEIPVGRKGARGYGDARDSLHEDTGPRTAHGSCNLEHYRIESVVRQGCPLIHQGNSKVVGRDPPASSGRRQSNQDSVSQRSGGGYRQRICGGVRRSRPWAAAVEEGGMLIHRHTRIPVCLPECSNHWRRCSIAPSWAQKSACA